MFHVRTQPTKRKVRKRAHYEELQQLRYVARPVADRPVARSTGGMQMKGRDGWMDGE